jgi:beta-glucosidase/6-phospho-beta-glucosidase/beta-galactosidase
MSASPLRASQQEHVGARPFVGAFESTYLPGHGVDVAETTGHDAVWRADVDSVLDAGVKTLRYPLRWHRIESDPGRFVWDEADAVLGHLRERGAHVVVDLVHHTSCPEWLDDGFRDRRFAGAFLRYAEAVAARYPWLPSYTLFNEPFATLFLAGAEALWPPYDRGTEGFVRLLTSVLPAVSGASRCWAELLPEAEHVWIDTCEHHRGTPGEPERYAALANDRRHVVLDLVLHHDLDPERPFLRRLLDAGGEALLELDAVRVDRLGLDYYCHSEWFYDEQGSRSPSPYPLGFAALAEQYGDRYGLPMLLAETNLRGLPTDRASWLRHTLEQYELAVARGVDLSGYCWFPSVDSCDWDSLLARPAGRVDPVGVVSLGADGRRQETAFTRVWMAAAAGAPVASLPAYRFQPPCDAQLAGLLAHMDHWPWQDPPADEQVPPVHLPPLPDL